jgi:hypothetical protein
MKLLPKKSDWLGAAVVSKEIIATFQLYIKVLHLSSLPSQNEISILGKNKTGKSKTIIVS